MLHAGVSLPRALQWAIMSAVRCTRWCLHSITIARLGCASKAGHCVHACASAQMTVGLCPGRLQVVFGQPKLKAAHPQRFGAASELQRGIGCVAFNRLQAQVLRDHDMLNTVLNRICQLLWRADRAAAHDASSPGPPLREAAHNGAVPSALAATAGACVNNTSTRNDSTSNAEANKFDARSLWGTCLHQRTADTPCSGPTYLKMRAMSTVQATASTTGHFQRNARNCSRFSVRPCNVHPSMSQVRAPVSCWFRSRPDEFTNAGSTAAK